MPKTTWSPVTLKDIAQHTGLSIMTVSRVVRGRPDVSAASRRRVLAAVQRLGYIPARVVWVSRPNLQVAAGAWILAGGAHHTGFSQVVTAECLEDFAEIAGMEYLLIGNETRIDEFKKELRWNDLYYHLAQGKPSHR